MGSWLAEQWLGKYSWRQHGLAFEKHPQKLPTLRSQNSLLTWLNVIGGKSPFQSPGEIFHMQWIDLKVSPSKMWKDGCFFISQLILSLGFGSPPYLGGGGRGESFSHYSCCSWGSCPEKSQKFSILTIQCRTRHSSLLPDYDLGRQAGRTPTFHNQMDHHSIFINKEPNDESCVISQIVFLFLCFV